MLWSVWACCSELQPVRSQYTEIERGGERKTQGYRHRRTEAGVKGKKVKTGGGGLLNVNYSVLNPGS